MSGSRTIKQLTSGDFDRLFPDDDACKAYLLARRWPNGVCCPRCGNEKVTELATRPFHWQCRKMLVSKKGISALQVHRMMGFGSYNTAYYICQRIRAGLIDPEFRKLMGIVEVDETYIGGKNRNRHWDKKTEGTGGAGKSIVAGAISRKGNVVARVIRSTDASTLQGFVREAVSTKVDLLATDENPSYFGLTEYRHGFVRHTRGEYVIGAVHTQTIDSFWSLIKRGIMGTFHKVGAKYLPRYVAEFEFRYNNRNNRDIFGAAVARC